MAASLSSVVRNEVAESDLIVILEAARFAINSTRTRGELADHLDLREEELFRTKELVDRLLNS